jgi:hypothetical protein
MSKAVIYEGLEGEFEGDEEVTDVTVFDVSLRSLRSRTGLSVGARASPTSASSKLRPSRPSGTTPSRSLASSPCKGWRA